MNMGKLVQSVKMAVKSILGNRGRSALTMLGVIIGVASVILLTGIGGGASEFITEQLSSLGTKMITVNFSREFTSRSIKEEDMQKFAEENSDIISDVSPYITGMVQAKNGDNNTGSSLDAVDSCYNDIKEVKLVSGRFFTENDVSRRSKVAIVGTYIVQELYAGLDPTGETIKLNGQPFTVIGVYEESGDFTENSADNKITIPYTTASRFLQNSNVTKYYLAAATEDTVDAAVSATKAFITKKFGSSDGFSVSSVAEMLDTLDEMMGTLTMMLAGIAAISLVVGGIGIMNIMTVSVSERTREIGIRKAIGARTTDILLQFLIELVFLSAIGGLIGILVGIGFGQIICKLINMSFAPQSNMIAMSFLFSIFIGVFFGIAPAKKAAKLHPIDALRSE